MFSQGQFLIDPNAPPEEIVRKRAALNKVMRAYGRANNIGEGVGDLLMGVGQGVQNRRVGQAERAQSESANSMFDSLFGGGEPAAPSIDAGGFPSAPASPGFPPAPATSSGMRTVPAGDGAAPSTSEIEGYIRESAVKRGIDPEVAVRVAKSEGLAPGTWQSNVVKNGQRETSYGPFQLLVGGGLGDKFQKVYGKSPADPSTVRDQIDFALDEAAQGGWGPWYGAAKVGVDSRTGLDNARALGYQPQAQLQGQPQTAADAVNIMGNGGQDTLGGGAGNDQLGGDWLRYTNQNAIRNKPISPRLQNALGFLPELGVTAEVFSGGQEGDRRTGSTRHDHGGSGDFVFYKDGRQLDYNNPQDLPIFQEIVRRGRENGITGMGAGDGYMRPGSMHIGFGNEAVWGAGGKGANAPDWLRSAYGSQGQSVAGGGGMDNMSGSAGGDRFMAAQRPGSAMDVWQGRAAQGIASDGSQLVRTPDGVRRTSTKGYSEIIRPEGPPSERQPMPRQGQGGGIGAIVASLLGRGATPQQPQAQPIEAEPQAMPMNPNAAQGQPPGIGPSPEQPMTAPVVPVQRQPTPQGQPPIPGTQPTAPTMQDMAGRMPAPEGQPMPQGRDALAAALMQQQAAPQAQQAIEQAAPQEVDPRAQFNSPQLNAADPTQGILKVLMERGGQPAQANPAVSRVQQAMQGQGGGTQNIGKLIELANNPFLSAGKRAVVGAMLERTMKAQDPEAQLDLEIKQLQLEQMRTPKSDPFTLSPGQVRYDANGNKIAEGAPDPGAPTVKTIKLSDGSEVAVQWNAETKAWDPINAPQGGGLATPKDKLTEGQAKLTLFQSMQNDAQPVLLDLEERFNPANMADAVARSTPIAGNFFQSPEGQMYTAASGQWAEGALRIATGAAATQDEIDRTRATYFAQPGDTPLVIAFKAQMRESYGRAIRRSLGEKNVEGNLPLPSEFAKSFAEGTQAADPAAQPDAEGWQELAPGVRVRRMD